MHYLLCTLAVLASAQPLPLLPSRDFTTIVGAPTVIGGPASDLFDQPHLALRTSLGTLGYTSNAQSVLYSRGATIEARLPTPLPVGLLPDPSPASFSHCGKWLNAAHVDGSNASLVHGFFHQEWRCDYAHNLYTNKSIGYALSSDGGLTFSPQAQQIIAGRNFSAALRASQCGEGDHGVLALGGYLYLYFLEWDAPKGISVGVARAAASSGGRPGSWGKWLAGGWDSPGVGGDADAVAGLPGTAVYALQDAPGAGALMAIGVMFSGPLSVAYSSAPSNASAVDPVQWEAAAAGPLFTARASSWARTGNSSELFGYPALVGEQGASPLPSAHFVYFTYLNAGRGFDHRFLVQRPVTLYYSAAPTAAPAAPPPPALAALSLWRSVAGAALQEWATSGPVTPASAPPPTAYALAQPQLALLVTWDAGGALVELVDCACNSSLVLALRSECGGVGGVCEGRAAAVLRTSGWVGASAAVAGALGWGGGTVRTLAPPSPAVAAQPLELWRCSGLGGANYSAAVGVGGCEARGWVSQLRLGFALGAPV